MHAVQPDGRMLIGGNFTQVNGQPHSYIARLNADGSLDGSFAGSANNLVLTLALQPDGKILAGGSFGVLSGQSHSYIGRLNTNGSADGSFNSSASYAVRTLAIQPDNRILVGGQFQTLSGESRLQIGRLNSDGTADTSFNPGANHFVESFSLQTDGKILVSGLFTALGGPCNFLGRLNADGSLDTNFNAGVDGTVYCVAVQPDGKVVAAGGFSNLGGQPRANIGRLYNTETATGGLSLAGDTITWTRGGTSPEVWRTTFESSTNGTDWTYLGSGTRVPGGWQLAGVNVTTNANIRARGFTTGGNFNGCSWFVETIIGGPAILDQPASVTVNAGNAAMFSVIASGSEPMAYQWRKDGTNVVDAGNVSGTSTATLMLSNLFGAQMGAYSVLVSNSFGTMTSAVASLIVLEPVITNQPANVEIHTGQDATFSVGVVGTPPLGYQWFYNGGQVSGATASSLMLTNLQNTNASGPYSVMVSNAFGVATSAVATLIVDVATADVFNPGADNTVDILIPQADGKILAGGIFNNVQGQPRHGVARLNGDGTLDLGFAPEVVGGQYPSLPVMCFAVQSDGRIVVGGGFTTLAGQSVNALGRVNPDGSMDTNFLMSATDTAYPWIGTIALQTNGQIIAGGRFVTFDGHSQALIARLNPDGTLDQTFTPGQPNDGFNHPNYEVRSIVVQPDGRILVGGWFTKLAGTNCSYLGRLNPDGTLDSSFSGIGFLGGFKYPEVETIALQPDGRILVGGYFKSVAGQTRNYLCRLNADGSLDAGFNPGANNFVSSFALQADGKILVAGPFTQLAGQPCSGLGRLNPDGSLDQDFNPGANSSVLSIALQSDGKILAGGSFSMILNQGRTNLARVLNFGAATDSLGFDGAALTWLRGGTAPEVWRTTFEASTDGTNWSGLGSGSRIVGGWQLTNVSPASGATVRARGFVAGGQFGGSGWIVERQIQVPVSPHPVISVNDSAFGISSNGFGFNFHSLSGQVVVVEGSTDLLNWVPLQTNTMGSGAVYFSDPAAASFKQRFYRILVP